jgi:hypothetical protein
MGLILLVIPKVCSIVRPEICGVTDLLNHMDRSHKTLFYNVIYLLGLLCYSNGWCTLIPKPKLIVDPCKYMGRLRSLAKPSFHAEAMIIRISNTILRSVALNLEFQRQFFFFLFYFLRLLYLVEKIP